MKIGQLRELLNLSAYSDDGEVVIELDGLCLEVDRSYPMHTNDIVLKVKI